MIDYLGGDSIAAGKLKEAGDAHWISPKTDATNLSGFTALPAGYKRDNTFFNLGEEAHYWSSETGWETVLTYKLTYNSPKIEQIWVDAYLEGASIRCIKDKVYDIIDFGDTLALSITQIGTYPFYATQTISNCESPLDTVTLTINPIPAAPLVDDITVCHGEEIPDLSATGENIQWYTDSELTTLVNSGNSFSTGQTQAGVYTYYFTQTMVNCESPADSVNLQIHSLPFVDLGNDTILFIDQIISLDIGIPEYSYSWNDGSDLSYSKISGSEIGLGDHTYWVVVTDTNSCTNSDSIVITVIDPTNLEFTNASNSIKIYPLPANDILNIETGGIRLYSIEITSLNGHLIFSTEMEGTILQIDLSSFQKGVYFITIRSKDFVTTEKIIEL